ncbi:TonB-dependent receptor domain-containing protein [Novosphingobium resinovorum]|uniref:TonB-dependent receptor domain-containing protein n=1 Tax=Novosphingobium resinovorum TaxID=158500 RepID=UPI002ED30024|nr:TonB-dependent receptor [Novosphingobium resinovorum]
MKSTLLSHASIAALLWTGTAHAQNTAQDAAPATRPAPPQAAEASAQDIIVTGSRVISNGNNSPTPVTVVSTEQAQKVQPGTLADSLQILPVFSGSRGSGSNPSSTGSVGGGNGSANQLNLRNIGPEKTLVLMDGKRIPPTLNSGIVDVDSIPQMMVKRVDVVTGGASAVYGSDAVAGVVNYIIDHDLQGLKVEGETGISQRGDAAKYRLGAAWGTDLFGGRGHFEISYEYQKESGIDRRSDRSWMRQAGVTGSGTEANPYVNQKDLRQSGYSAGGLITSGVLAGQTFNADGSLRDFQHGTATGTSGVEVGGDGAYYDSTLMAPLEFNQFFGRFDYDVSDDVHAYVQVGGNFKTNTAYGDNLTMQNFTIRSDNPYLSQQYRDQLAGAGESTFKLSEIMQGGPRLGATTRTEQVNMSAGLNGKLGDFRWTADYVHGQSILKNTQLNNVNRQHLAEALDAVSDGAGNVVCRVALTDPGSACAPLNPFGEGAASAESLAYVQQDTHYRAKTVLDDATASISGRLFDTWAGPVNVALSGEWRKLSFRSSSDAGPEDYADCAGITYNCTATTLLWQNTFAASPRISNTVWEGAVEASVPLLADLPFAQSFDLSGAARYTSYQTSGRYWTWKVGFDWHVNDALRFRGTRSRDIRAPTLNDLFAPTYVSVVRSTDRLTGTAPQVSVYNQSNPDLKAEVGNTLTVGLVWNPAPAFSIAVDYYKIKVTNAITQLQGNDPQIQDLCYASGGTSAYCDLQVRPNGYTDPSSTNSVTSWVSRSINLSEVSTEGVDVEANFRSSLLDRPFSLRLLGAYQPHIYYKQPGVETRDQAGAAFGPLGAAAAPTVRLTGIVHFEPSDHVSIDILERWRNAMTLSGYDSEIWVDDHLKAFATTNVTVTFKPESTYNAEFYLNVQNLFDAKPPTGGFTGNGTRAGFRDGYPVSDSPLGRFFTAGVRAKF